MWFINEDYEAITEDSIDLTKGFLTTATVVKEDAEPIDDITKFAWDDDDYEKVQMYVLNKEEGFQPSQTDELAQVIDALLGFGGV